MPKLSKIYVGSRSMHAATITHRHVKGRKEKLTDYRVEQLQVIKKNRPNESTYSGSVGKYQVIWDQSQDMGGCITIIGRRGRRVEEIASEMIDFFGLEEVELPGYKPRTPNEPQRE